MLKGSLPEVFLDTDVAFDIISKREPHFENAIKLLEMASKDQIALQIAESSIANLIYLSFEIYKLADASSKILNFIGACNVVNGGKPIILEALASPFKVKEDALQYYTALHSGADYFITRKTKHYKFTSPMLPVFHPLEFYGKIL
ncbi:type II toxin-antitoxin system VapC family toxin [Cyclobacterium roseum]|uniref:type II toxin-antitoxin system VapC family toxin n=1 Tax=Cyclobacterium roseum TaxID=2666137 RepID=UPI00139089EE|nr:PIN domain-containing protein [Cyclobacterium roseum]